MTKWDQSIRPTCGTPIIVEHLLTEYFKHQDTRQVFKFLIVFKKP